MVSIHELGNWSHELEIKGNYLYEKTCLALGFYLTFINYRIMSTNKHPGDSETIH